jgi:hypothetical protein
MERDLLAPLVLHPPALVVIVVEQAEQEEALRGAPVVPGYLPTVLLSAGVVAVAVALVVLL